MKRYTILSAILFFTMASLQAGPLKLCGRWEAEEGGIAISLRPPEQDSFLETWSEGTRFFFPVTWTATGRDLTVYFQGPPRMETIDPFYELSGPPSAPKLPRSWRYRLAKDGASLTLEKKKFHLIVSR